MTQAPVRTRVTRSAVRTTPRRPPAAAAARPPSLVERVGALRGPAWLDGPMISSHLVLGAGGMLLLIGLVMVFSASSVTAALAGEPAWQPGVTQLGWAAIGLVGLLVALRLPIGLIRRWCGVGLIVSFVSLCLVLVIGVELNGARQWFNLGIGLLQPSEIAKLVVALWGAHVLATRDQYLTTRTLLNPIVPVFLVFSAALMLEPDFGATVTLALVVAGLLWAGGLPWKFWAGLAGAAVALMWLAIKLAPYRAARITAFLHPFDDPTDGGWQAIKGLYALASGGLWGVGLGNSAMKWGLLPHAQSDYIFAIIGEELGFLGCLVVISLYGVLAYSGFRIARRATDRFVQVASIAITVWLIGQATMNMGYVVGMLPVTGVQLPLISAGGTSLTLTLFIIGLLARFARTEPAAVEWGRTAERSRLARLLLPIPTRSIDSPHARRPAPERRPRATEPRAASRVRVPAPARDGSARPLRREPVHPVRAPAGRGTPRDGAPRPSRQAGAVRTDPTRARSPRPQRPERPGRT